MRFVSDKRTWGVTVNISARLDDAEQALDAHDRTAAMEALVDVITSVERRLSALGEHRARYERLVHRLVKERDYVHTAQ